MPKRVCGAGLLKWPDGHPRRPGGYASAATALRNTRCKMHVDKGNEGLSTIVTLGRARAMAGHLLGSETSALPDACLRIRVFAVFLNIDPEGVACGRLVLLSIFSTAAAS